MAERPTFVLIGPHRFAISYDQHYFLNMARSGAGDMFGESSMADMIIRVSDARALSGMKETLLHEVIHCLIWEAGISIPENPEEDAHKREEKLVGQLSGIFLDVLRRNLQLVEWLVEEDPQ